MPEKFYFQTSSPSDGASSNNNNPQLSSTAQLESSNSNEQAVALQAASIFEKQLMSRAETAVSGLASPSNNMNQSAANPNTSLQPSGSASSPNLFGSPSAAITLNQLYSHHTNHFASSKSTVDFLVHGIRENLQVSDARGHGAGKAPRRSLVGRRSLNRPSPYAAPPSSRVSINPNYTNFACDNPEADDAADSNGKSKLKRWNHQRRRYPSTCMNAGSLAVAAAVTNTVNAAADGCDSDADDDHFMLMKELLSHGDLIKEAVRRLQTGFDTINGKNGQASPVASSSFGGLFGPKGLVVKGPSKTPRNYYDSDDDEDCRTPPNFNEDSNSNFEDVFQVEAGESVQPSVVGGGQVSAGVVEGGCSGI